MAKYNIFKAMSLAEELLEVIHDDDDYMPEPQEIKAALEILSGSTGLEKVGFRVSPKLKDIGSQIRSVLSFF